MFVDVLSHVFRGKNAPEDQLMTDEMKARAKISYDLLSAFKYVPGLHKGKIDVQVLSEWVVKARTLTTSKGLDEIALLPTCDERRSALGQHQRWPE
jgi:hypothetical protein